MPIILTDLPYAVDALEPHISRRTLEIHHGAHHKGYVDKVNKAIEGTGLADKPLEAIVRESNGSNQALFNSAAQTWNHGFYWRSLTPQTNEPSGALASAIDRDFGSLATLKQELATAATGHFGSGWAWLARENGKLKVITTHDAATPITGGAVPLLTIDVWEHAYYLFAQNRRDSYVQAVTDNLLDWNFAAENFAHDDVWTYG